MMLRRTLPILLLLSCTNAKTDPATDVPPPETAKPEAKAEVPEPKPKQPEPEPTSWASVLPKDAGERDVAKLAHVQRLPDLTDEHRRHLKEHGFFITAQATPAKKSDDAARARAGRRARHMFQVYERNDYIRFPSYVTVDLSVDLVHQYFDVVLRKIEREHLVPKLHKALQGFVESALALRKSAKTPAAKKAALDAAVYWGTALRLLEQPAKGDAPEVAVARAPWYDDPDAREEMGETEGEAPKATKPTITKLDPAISRDVDAAVKAFHAASGRKTFDRWGQRFDLTLAKPRGHYAGSGVLQRYFRSMTMLGLSRFAIEGEDARPEVLAAIATSMESSPPARKEYEDVLRLTNFVVGEPPTKGLVEASLVASKHAGSGGLDAMLEAATLAKIVADWKAFPEHPVAKEGPVVMPIGQRVFLDTQAMSMLLPIVRELPESRGDFVARAMGAAGSAAAMGSDAATQIVLAKAAEQKAEVEAAMKRGRTLVEGATPKNDAYHGTLRALDQVLETDPLYFDPDGHDLRMLQTYAGGWAMLRHDTLLYAYQMGAECDAEDLLAPYGWVEPYPEVYGALKTMVASFSKQLKGAGIATAGNEEEEWGTGQFSIGTKTKAVLDYLDRMIVFSNKELSGEPFTEEERTDVAIVGGYAEQVVLTLADAFELGDGNDDMAVIADVFTFRGKALEVGVGHPELIYAVIPTPEGWALARGAVLAYREFFVGSGNRLTDEQWRDRLDKSKDFEIGSRPAWLNDISAPPVGVIDLPPDGQSQSRCEYFGGLYEL